MTIEKKIEETTDKPVKPKRVMSEKQKEALKKGREKAHQKLKEARDALKEKNEIKQEPVPCPVIQNEVVEQEIETEIVYKKKPKQVKKKQKKQVVIVEESSESESSDDEPIVVRRSARKKKEPVPPPPPTPNQPQYITKPRNNILFS